MLIIDGNDMHSRVLREVSAVICVVRWSFPSAAGKWNVGYWSVR